MTRSARTSMHAAEVEALALHLLPDAVEVLRPALHLRRAGRARRGRRPSSARRRRDARLAVGAPLVELARDRVVALGLEEAEREVLELPLDLPDAEPVGERREHLHRLGARARARTASCSPRTSAASAGARPGAAAPRAGRARTRAASCARARSAAPRSAASTRAPCAARCRSPSLRVCATRPPATRRRRRQHLFGLAELVGGVDEVGRGAQRRRGADLGQDRGRRRRRARARPRRCRACARRAAARRIARARDRSRSTAGAVPRLGRRRAARRPGSSGASRSRTIGAAASTRLAAAVFMATSRNSRTTATWSAATSVGAWPTPANSCRRALRAARASSPAAVARDSRSESAPRSSSVGQRIAS